MANSHKRGIAEDRERAETTLPTQRWWIGVALWIIAALVAGVLYRWIAPVTNDGIDRITLLRNAVTLVLNVVVMYGISYYAARQTLARRSLREIWKLESNREALNRLGLPVVLSVAALAFLVATNSVTESLFQGLLAASTIFSIYRALTTAYTSHYFDFVISPRESREFTNDRAIKSKKRLFLERAAVTLGLNYPRQRLAFPLVQTVLVAFGLQTIMTMLLIQFGVTSTEAAASPVLSVIAPILPVISVVLWSIWHLYGGIGRITRISSGRPMKSFGWQHPELFVKVK